MVEKLIFCPAKYFIQYRNWNDRVPMCCFLNQLIKRKLGVHFAEIGQYFIASIAGDQEETFRVISAQLLKRIKQKT